MLKRIGVYLKEMYPVLPRLFLSAVLFFEIYFLVILTNDKTTAIRFSMSEIAGWLTVFFFLLSLRIADEFKDFESDKKLFPERPYPSGRVKKKDLVALLAVISAAAAALNAVFLRGNLIFFGILCVYAVLMGVWFFSSYKMQKNLLLALLTHNPVQLFINLYIIAFTCRKYGIEPLRFDNLMILVTLYFPGLVWEISRKIRAPGEETEYLTYSKLWGLRRAVRFVLGVMTLDMLTSSYLMFRLFPPAVATVVGCYGWLVKKCVDYIKNPAAFRLVKKIELYEYVTESTVIAVEAFCVLFPLAAAKAAGWWTP